MTNKQRIFNEQVENMKKLMLVTEEKTSTNEVSMFSEQLAKTKKLMLGTEANKPTATKSVIKESFQPLPVSNEPQLEDIAMETELTDEPDGETMMKWASDREKANANPQQAVSSQSTQPDNNAPDQESLLKMAEHYADSMYSKYVDPASLNFEGDAESWYFDFNLNIPKNVVPNMQTPEDVESILSGEINYSSHGVEGNPGGAFSRAGVRDVQDGGDYWIVTAGARGGMDV